jgi:peptide deformylase
MEIVYYPDPVLRRRAGEVPPGRRGLEELVREMLESMEEAHGIGLAAPQVGESLRLFVASDTGRKEDALVFCNPSLSLSGDVIEMEEGCLSLPGLRGMVRRPARATVHAQRLDGTPFTLEAEGLLARICQHEYDHLEGVLFIDRLSPTERARLRGDIRSFEEQFRPR